MVFDWEKAARVIKKRKAYEAFACPHLNSATEILRHGHPVPRLRPLAQLESMSGPPKLEVDGCEIECYRMQNFTPGWDGDTYWPTSALLMLGLAPFTMDWPLPAHLYLVPVPLNADEIAPDSGKCDRLDSDYYEANDYDPTSYLFGLEHLTLGREQRLYWKGTIVSRLDTNTKGTMMAAAARIAEQCSRLESKGFPVNGRTVLRSDREVGAAPAGTPWLEVVCQYYGFYVRKHRVRVALYKDFRRPGVIGMEKREGRVYAEEYDGGMEANEGICAQGFERIDGDLSYSDIAQILERSSLTRMDIRAALSFEKPVCVKNTSHRGGRARRR